MHPALWTLMRLQWRGQLRNAWRTVQTVRGAIVALFFGGAMLFSCGIALVGWLQPVEAVTEFRAGMREFAPLAMLLFWILGAATSAGKLALVFSPAEVDLLFPAPLGRRQLVLFKLVGGLSGTAVRAVMLSLIFRASYTSWPAGVLGLLLVFSFFRLSLMAVALVRETVAERAYNLTRRAALAAVLLSTAWVVGYAAAQQGAADWRELWEAFRQSWVGTCLLAPFAVFSRVLTAERLWPDALAWGAAALTMDLGLVALVLLLDANYLESAAAASRERYELAQRIRRGDWMSAAKVKTRWRLPGFGWLAGAGPVAWRQSLHLLRTSLNMVYGAAVCVAIGAAALAFYDTPDMRIVMAGLFGYLGGLSLFGAAFFPFGLRAETDRIDLFKTLPIPPAVVVAGEILPPAILFAAVQWLLFAAAAVVVADAWPIALTGACFALPVDLLLLALNNLLFLLFPSRTARDIATYQFQPTLILLMPLYPLAMVLASVAAGCGGVAWLVFGRSGIAFAAGAWCAVWLEAALALACTAWAFRRFDVSLETPPE